MFRQDLRAGPFDAGGLVAIKAGRLDVLFDLRNVRPGPVGGAAVFLEQVLIFASGYAFFSIGKIFLTRSAAAALSTAPAFFFVVFFLVFVLELGAFLFAIYFSPSGSDLRMSISSFLSKIPRHFRLGPSGGTRMETGTLPASP